MFTERRQSPRDPSIRPAKPVGLPVTTRFKFCDGALCVKYIRPADAPIAAAL
jgi:hypothetical protein